MKKKWLICGGLFLLSAMLCAGGNRQKSSPDPIPVPAEESKLVDSNSNPNPVGEETSSPIEKEPDPPAQGDNSSALAEAVAQTKPPTGTNAPRQPPQTSREERPAGSLPRLGILPFTGTNRADGENIALLLSNEREMRAAFTMVIPRISSINVVELDQDFKGSGLTDTDVIASIGKQLEVDFIITGHIQKLGNRNLIIMTMVKVATFQQIAGGYREFQNIADIRGLLPDMVKKMVDASKVDTSQMPTLAILPFAIPAKGVSVQDAEVLIQLLTIELANSGRYAVLPRTKTIETALGIVETLRTELKDMEAIKAVGKTINAQCVLMGNVMQLGDNLNLFLAQILNLENLALRSGGDVEYRNITDGFQLMPELAFQLTGVRSGMAQISIPENMVWIAGGSFRMGGSTGDADEQPVHIVQVNSFFMGKTLVTQKEYEAIMGSNPSKFKGDMLPVENVTWYDAVEYCNKLSAKEGLTPAYSGSNDNITCNFTANGYRLPTEAEWEYAAKGGNRDTLSFEYAGGNNPAILGWYNENSNHQTHEVETKNPNALGLYDITGNVWEWCWDWYGVYAEARQQNPQGPAAGEYRVNRGGSWSSDSLSLRSTYRNVANPRNRYSDLGFRVLRPIF